MSQENVELVRQAFEGARRGRSAGDGGDVLAPRGRVRRGSPLARGVEVKGAGGRLARRVELQGSRGRPPLLPELLRRPRSGRGSLNTSPPKPSKPWGCGSRRCHLQAVWSRLLFCMEGTSH